MCISWDDRMLIGHAEIDREHRRLFEVAERLDGEGEDGAPAGEICEVLCELADYSRDHFAREENLMRIARFPRCVEHVVEHWKFIQTLTRLNDAYERGRTEVLPELRAFLGEWLASHITVDDRQFGDFLRQTGQTV